LASHAARGTLLFCSITTCLACIPLLKDEACGGSAVTHVFPYMQLPARPTMRTCPMPIVGL